MQTGFSFGLIGCGHIAHKHAKLIQQHGRLVAVCDIDEKKAIDLGKKFEAYSYFNIDDLVLAHPDIDIMVVCTPNGLHAEHSIKAMEAGMHVLCEKPMALTIEDCGKMVATSEKYRKFLHVVMQNRFNPPVQYLKKVLDNNSLGSLYSLSLNGFWQRPREYYEVGWKGTTTMDGGILFTQFSHFFDLLVWLFGTMKCLSAHSNNYNHKGITEFDDTILANVLFEDNILGSLHFTTSVYKKNMEGSLTVIGEKGSLKIGGPYLNTIEYHDIEGLEPPVLPPANPPNDYGNYQGTMSNHHLVYGAFMSGLKNHQFMPDHLGDSGLVIANITDIHNHLLPSSL